MFTNLAKPVGLARTTPDCCANVILLPLFSTTDGY